MIRQTTILYGLFLGVSGLCGLTGSVDLVAADNPPDFESEVAPLLVKRCLECHQKEDPAGGLSLTSRESFVAGGDSGSVIDREQADSSLLLERIHAGEMPPEQRGKSQQLPDDEAELISRWVAAGAPWPADRELDYFERTTELRAGRDWWSLQPVVKPAIPQLEKFPQPEHPIDAFILARLEEQDVTPAPTADRQTLIRRLYYDLIGLAPSEEEIQAFVNDQRPDAWSRKIDQLLEMPHYGERWGRYWLDLARYADTSGYERDQEKPFAWKYRDWVVNAFNADMPYREFIIHQLAGDEIADRDEQSVIATGFLRLGPWNDEPNDPADYQYERLEDAVHTTSSAFIALTVKCARCHSHKFDAITQDDYYRMASAFWAGPITIGGSRDQLGGPTAEELGYENVLGWTDLGSQPSPLHVLKNGERHQPLHEVIPASLSSVPSLERQFSPPPEGARTSQRRLQLAEWIADPRNPLTARVLVNRIWQHHFGQGLVRTPNNFGFLADPPTHPDLLDWLAAEFLSRGQSIKSLHRLILTSRTWQQSSLHPDARQLEQRDSTNRWWWRAERRRLDAETLRDSLLQVSGELDRTVGGVGFKPTISAEALEGLSRKSAAWQASAPEVQKRRSLYMYLKRGLLPPFMTTFDLCDPTQSCGRRDVTIVPTQALALLNNQFVHDRSQFLATSIMKSSADPEAQVRHAWSRILRRQPEAAEIELSLRHLKAQQTRFSKAQEKVSEENVVSKASRPESPTSALRFHLRADQAMVERVGDIEFAVSVRDLSGHDHLSQQESQEARPRLQRNGFGGKPTLVFDGQRDFLHVSGNLLEQSDCTLICVVRDDRGTGHREIISNWNGSQGNSGRSVFLGLTAERVVRFSDAFSPGSELRDRSQPFILSATNDSQQAVVYQNGRELGMGASLPDRRLDTAWVIGQQGNIDGEFWQGGIAEIRIYDRALSLFERQFVERELAEYYGIEIPEETQAEMITPESFALASLCHVLMNSNEFLYVD